MNIAWWRLALVSLFSLAALPPARAQQVPEFQLNDYRGGEHRLSDWSQKKLVVLVFLGVDCPMANQYAHRLEELSAEFAGKGVQIVGVNSNRQDAPSDIDRYAQAHKISFPILKDVGNHLADHLGARRTPEAFLFDAKRVVVYHGRIDDQFTPGVARPKIGRRDLAMAIEEALADKPISVPSTEATGCLISRVTPSTTHGALTYCKHIAPLVQKHCLSCHRPNQVAPFSLLSYDEVSSWADTIEEVVTEGRMPPWHANPKYGHFKNDPRLTEEEKQTIRSWVKAGTPFGDAKDLPEPILFQEGWTIPPPDVVISMAKPFTIPAHGVLNYQFFDVDPGFTEDKWVQMIEIRPGNRGVVHHCTVFLRPPDSDEAVMVGELGSMSFAAMAPGTPPMILPEGMAKRVPAGWHFVFVVHYTTIGTEQTDQTRLGLVYAKPGSVKKEVATNVVLDTGLNIPPFDPDWRVEQTTSCDRDVLLLALFPHMHYRGKSFNIEAEFPNGSREILLDVPSYDLNWEHRYELAEPKRLPAGTILHITGHYDNSANNPRNPAPEQTVHTGSQITDEMFNAYMEIALADQDLTRPLSFWDMTRETAHDVFRPSWIILLCTLFLAYCGIRRLALARASRS